MIVYKVVKPSGNRYYSMLINRNNKYCMSYKVGLTTIAPKDAPIFAFKDMYSVRRFLARLASSGFLVYNVFECEAEVMECECEFILSKPYLSKKIRKFWSGTYNRYTEHILPVPSGTVFCSSITPLKVVYL